MCGGVIAHDLAVNTCVTGMSLSFCSERLLSRVYFRMNNHHPCVLRAASVFRPTQTAARPRRTRKTPAAETRFDPNFDQHQRVAVCDGGPADCVIMDGGPWWLATLNGRGWQLGLAARQLSKKTPRRTWGDVIFLQLFHNAQASNHGLTGHKSTRQCRAGELPATGYLAGSIGRSL